GVLSEPRVEAGGSEGAGAAGIECEEGGRGRFEDCVVSRAGAAGVAVGKGAAPVLVRTNVEAALVGVSVGRGGEVTVEDCTLRGLAVAGASVQAGASGRFSRSRLRGGRFGIHFAQPAGGQTVEQCEVSIDNGEVAA